MQEQETITPMSSLKSASTKKVAKFCFDKSEFMKESFSDDEFLRKCRNVPSLEQLRDDLGLYLKELRAGMIDLINEDYADFVNLSANLAGFDQTIANIQEPLKQFRKEVEGMHEFIQESENSMRTNLENKRKLRQVERNKQCLEDANETITKLKSFLETQLKDKPKPIHLERAALDIIQLRFNQKFAIDLFKDGQKEKCEKLEKEVLSKIRQFFNESLKNASSTFTEELERCLRIYVTLDACGAAEKVFQEDVVAPYMSAIITEHSLQNSPQGLAGIYSKILNFISLHMTDLLRLTQYTDKLSGFDFLVNSFWTDVEMRLETYMTSIFAPGNSDVFYTKYKCTRDFLKKIEQLLNSEDACKKFRQHRQTKSFEARWNLPVYFQICFQEIAGEFESSLEPLLHDKSLNTQSASTDGSFNLESFNKAKKAIERCWSEGVYLTEVFPKFYKLNVQILLRLSRWITDVTKYADISSRSALTTKINKISLLSALYADVYKLLSYMVQIQETVIANVPIEKKTSNVNEAISKSLADVQDTLSCHLTTIQDVLVRILLSETGVENVRQVKDLPRLYRKTNREVPTRCSMYIEQILRPLKSFSEQQNTLLGHTIVMDILTKVFSKITTDYFEAVSDVLTSVQKTEESLRRLRNLKSGGTTVPAATVATMSDDDKIRLQLRVDVIAWTQELAKLECLPTQIDKLEELNSIVEESTKLKEISGA